MIQDLSEVKFLEVDSNDSAVLKKIFIQRVESRQDKYISIDKFPNGWVDNMERMARHFIVKHNDNIVASCRLMLLENINRHPYYPAIQHLIPSYLLDKKAAYFSRDQVIKEYRGKGIHKMMFLERYRICKSSNINQVFIDVPETGYQLIYYLKQGYYALGYIDTTKIHWDLGPSILMTKLL